ncbi:YdeI/OmpD-associated family protein [Nocardia sp. NPDC101769]|uniref:YdeI/OmpD-associated family protein n=1 Tax=Nocardia sp. NPDC101769 TaxID=3364333 RepID=UPI00380EB5BF
MIAISCTHPTIRRRDRDRGKRRCIHSHSPGIITALGGGGRIPVQATFDSIPYRGSIANMNAGPCLGLLKAIRAELGKGPGDQVAVTVERDTADRALTIPDDPAAVLHAVGAQAAFDALSYTSRREHVTAVTGAKKGSCSVVEIDWESGNLVND